MSDDDRPVIHYTEAYLNAVANSLALIVSDSSLAGFKNDDDDRFVWISAGVGEIQLNNDGCWWLTWDQTHAVADEKELVEPVTDDPAVMARWLLEQVSQFEEHE